MTKFEFKYFKKEKATHRCCLCWLFEKIAASLEKLEETLETNQVVFVTFIAEKLNKMVTLKFN
ncbi:hypothetical protein T4E_9682 [Trichinella pseudospiralis]|uniref:Uncharacterized protein n=1 Tax=Trichinella pseudospiralis TaxID=6337 RepID=A0A0V0YCK0_TRIPS|nr:hypothetical protein T4E_9682 [Trichinella pseudospiralis]